MRAYPSPKSPSSRSRLTSSAEDSGAGTEAFSDGAVAADAGSVEEVLPIEQPSRAKMARALGLRTVMV